MSSRSYWSEDSVNQLRVTPGFTLAGVDTRAVPGFYGRKKHSAAAAKQAAGVLSQLQEKLFANSKSGDNRKILLVLQAMDTAGKGGIVRHVIGAVDPQGVSLHAFKAPTKAELRHDFLWRIRKRVPAAGMIGVFDRSHYEDVLIARVHELAPPAEIKKRYNQINAFEQELIEDDTTVIKVMLQISSNEQKSRLGERLDRPDKYWKYHTVDVDERMRWSAYQEAFQIVLERTSTAAAPWYVVPADRKWYARLVVQHLLIEALKSMVLIWPAADFDVAAEQVRLSTT